ncbi:TIGR03862 family flavoprotein [Rhizobiales bacterium]|uniref:NAD(P)/FAD-dependent oxidoreductase n=1 Tax=Hongsoonwoonella zoysiae TaxID=2821844 RepID=UPI00155F8ED2|nr:TIGR03862 family flavoprotein [Hongsoonwoonella zoysiae]NRG19956.1 TIGR03862 family flavoprotein [Hongsoonwoonella zoysiae]
MAEAHANIAIIGAGPAGLIAADRLSSSGYPVTLYERMPSIARKLLMAGRGGLNLTHSEDLLDFLSKYREARGFLAPLIREFDQRGLRDWCHGLGLDTFVGSSGRVFPSSLKASPLVRALAGRLARQGVEIKTGCEWKGFDSAGNLLIDGRDGEETVDRPAAVLLALGGASWPRLGSTGGWTGTLDDLGVPVKALQPSNCGFKVAWSPFFAERFAGLPLKRIRVTFADRTVMGEAMITKSGIEGGAIYALSADLRMAIEANGPATAILDLRPDMTEDTLTGRLLRPRGKQSASTFLRKAASLPPVAIALLREVGPLPSSPREIARLIKAYPLTLSGTEPIDRAISSAGGISLDALDQNMMLKSRPGVFAAGEMLDWEAPTGGYLLQATFATGLAAARGIERWLKGV